MGSMPAVIVSCGASGQMEVCMIQCVNSKNNLAEKVIMAVPAVLILLARVLSEYNTALEKSIVVQNAKVRNARQFAEVDDNGKITYVFVVDDKTVLRSDRPINLESRG